MKQFNLKKTDEFKELSNWIKRFQYSKIGSVSIVKNIIMKHSWEDRAENNSTSIIKYLKVYRPSVRLLFYKDLDSIKDDSYLKSEVLKEAVKRLVDSYPFKYNGENMGGDDSFSFLLLLDNIETLRLIAFPPVSLMEYCFKPFGDEQKKCLYLNIVNYLSFFVNNIQKYKDFYIDGKDAPPVRMYEGLSGASFMQKFNEQTYVEMQMDYMEWAGHQFDFESIQEEQCDLVLLQRRLESEKKYVSFGNIILLAEFIKEKCESRYFALLEPTIEEMLNAVEKLGGVSRVVFENEEGEKVVFDRTDHIELMKEAIKKQKKTKHRLFKVSKIVKWSELADQTIIQTLFVRDMVQFLNEYFPGERKKGSPVSTAEQELIRWVMYHVGLTKNKVSDSRFRQLLSYGRNSNIDNCPDYVNVPKEFAEETGIRIMALDYLSWEQWQNVSNIDWSQPINKFEPKDGDILLF